MADNGAMGPAVLAPPHTSPRGAPLSHLFLGRPSIPKGPSIPTLAWLEPTLMGTRSPRVLMSEWQGGGAVRRDGGATLTKWGKMS